MDGDADGTNTVDMGCYEFANPNVDTDGDTMTDDYEADYGLDPTDPGDQADNPDGDPHNNSQEFVTQTDPTDPDDYFRVMGISVSSPPVITFESSSNRLYSLYGRSTLGADDWSLVTGKMGEGGADSLSDTNQPPRGPYYRLGVDVP